MTNTSEPGPDRGHPLEEDPERLGRIVDVMWQEIHKVVKRTAPRRRRSAGSSVARLVGEATAEPLIAGTSTATDILADALADLLRTPAGRVTQSWEAIAVGIARNKAKGALRESQAGLRATANRPRLTVVSGDQPGAPGSDDSPSVPLLEVIADPGADLEDEFVKTYQQIELIRLARELLDRRDQTIFLGLQFQTCTRASLAEEFELTTPGVTHVYVRAARKLHADPRFPYAEGEAT
jgi:hypothetical protein